MTCPVTISVVIPAYNLSGYIEQTLLSVLAQTVLPDEIIVVDDGSVDDTVEKVLRVAGTMPDGFVRLLRQEQSGPGAARNRGIEAAQGDWIAFLDGDDLWLPHKIEQVRNAISTHPDVVIVTHDEYEVDEDGNEDLKLLHEYFLPEHPLFPQLYRRCFFSTSCMTIRKDVLLDVGGFDTSLPSAQDYELWLKVARYDKVVFVPEPLEKYIRRPFSISANVRKRLDCTLIIARRHYPRLKQYFGFLRSTMLYATVILIHHYGALRMLQAQGRHIAACAVLVRVPVALLKAIGYGLFRCR